LKDISDKVEDETSGGDFMKLVKTVSGNNKDFE
jgi:hypothetical protein